MFRVETQGAVDVVHVDGPLNVESVEHLHDTLSARLSDGLPMVVLDMAEVPIMDSAGLDALLDAQEQIVHQGGTLKLSGLAPLCQEVLRVTEVGKRFACFAETKSAVGSFVQ